MCRIAIALRDNRSFDEARDNLQEALRIALRVHGPDHLVTALVYKALGNVMLDMSVRNLMSADFNKTMQSVRECYEHTVRIITALHGEEHPEVKHTLGEIQKVNDLENM